jgi:L,D-peptidoglycan transpeptidase YkuD (ErfK/YbiS/YcfS/YnhG family)
MHEKDENGVWRQKLSSYAYVGKNGIGKTREGDKKTPTGTFNLKTPFGIKRNPGASLDYLQVTKYHYWCGTSGSKYYNQLIDTRVTARKRTSSDEYLIGYKGVYNYCAFIDYNASGEAGKGSCIFLHCTGSNPYTAGCVAAPESVMKKILIALKPGCKIVIH